MNTGVGGLAQMKIAVFTPPIGLRPIPSGEIK
jgi:hypothetical protein